MEWGYGVGLWRLTIEEAHYGCRQRMTIMGAMDVDD
jgi:hypothetical protein